MNIEQAIVYYNATIIDSAVKSTPPQKLTREEIKVKVKEKRKLRKDWQRTRHPTIKTAFNKATAELKVLLKVLLKICLQISLLFTGYY